MTARRLLAALFATVAAGALAGAAQADPPGRVGRVAYTEGDVSFLPPGSDSWTWASRNYPVAPGESFWTGDQGRARLQIGSVDTRLDSESELDVLDLEYGEMRLALPQGSMDVRLWATPRGGVTISTPAGDVRLDGQGLYRVDVGAPAGDGSYPLVQVTVFDGQAEAPSPEGRWPVYAGQAAILYAGYDPQVQDAEDASIDDWAQSLEARNRWRPEDLSSAAITGLGDLDGAGDYVPDPQFGRVWFPRNVPADWAPYRYGHWSYVEPWGYTWIDDQPWGFAPFHYGRWAQFGGRWGWIPGRAAAEPVYAPALVAFVGGVGWNPGGGDAIGWVPLGPDEVYRPSYAVSDGYWRRMNSASVRPTIIDTITNSTVNTGPTIVYRNAPAITVVRVDAFSGAQPVHRAVIPVSAAVIAHAPPPSPASRPPPTALARLGAGRPGGGAGVSSAPVAAARPPAALRAVRAAVSAPPAAGGRPPVILGARMASPAPRPAAGAAPVLIAPAQIHHPAAQGAAPPPVRPGPTTPSFHPGAAPPATRPEAPPAPEPRPPAARPPIVTRPVAPPPPAPDHAAAEVRRTPDTRQAAPMPAVTRAPPSPAERQPPHTIASPAAPPREAPRPPVASAPPVMAKRPDGAHPKPPKDDGPGERDPRTPQP